jgi:transcriptional regulator with XRE-family HTH domain
MTTDLGTWLRTQREERGWSRSDMARRLIVTGRETDDGLPSVENLRKSIYRWESGQVDVPAPVLPYLRGKAFRVRAPART